MVDARDFGVVGDGINDDLPALMAALRYAELVEELLYIPPGVYKVSEVLRIGGENK